MTAGNCHNSESGHEGQGWTGESLMSTQGTWLGLKDLIKEKPNRQRQKNGSSTAEREHQKFAMVPAEMQQTTV